VKRGVLLALAACVLMVGCRKEAEKPLVDDYVYEPVRIVTAYLAAMAKPESRQVRLVGEEAKRLAPYLVNAGIGEGTESNRCDLIVISGSEIDEETFGRLVDGLTEDGVLAWTMDMKDVTARRFRERLEMFTLKDVRLWMPGERRWLLTGRKKSGKSRLSGMLELFSLESSFEDLAKAGCGTVSEMFACYVGSREDLMPAFAEGDQTAIVKPEFYLTREIPSLDWIEAGNVDDDMAKSVLAEIRSMQVVRRLAVEGNMLSLVAKDKKGEEAAAEKWHQAMLRNPHELLVMERLDRLARNARGFLALGKVLQAMKCYETMVLIHPTASSVHNFGMCLKKIGKLDMAEQVLKRAKELEQAK